MNLQQAIEAMIEGHKVKLPEWGGYWFINKAHVPSSDNTSNIQVFTKQGDILDTAWVEKYKDREDFEITEGKLGFDFAILAMKNRKKVRRKSWGDSIQCIMYIRETFGEHKWEYEGYDGKEWFKVKIGETFAKLGSNDKLELGWRPTAADMTATDWVLVD